MEALGNIIIIFGIVFMLFGVIGIFKFENFYARILITAKIDTVGALTVIIGVALREGVGFFSLKLFLLMCTLLILNPLSTHIVARCAYRSGYKLDEIPYLKKSKEEKVNSK